MGLRHLPETILQSSGLHQENTSRMSTFLKDRYISQPVFTPTDAIITALKDVKEALTGKTENMMQAALESLTQVQTSLKPMTMANINMPKTSQVHNAQCFKGGTTRRFEDSHVPAKLNTAIC